MVYFNNAKKEMHVVRLFGDLYAIEWRFWRIQIYCPKISVLIDVKPIKIRHLIKNIHLIFSI